jgi:hypothetical protein
VVKSNVHPQLIHEPAVMACFEKFRSTFPPLDIVKSEYSWAVTPVDNGLWQFLNFASTPGNSVNPHQVLEELLSMRLLVPYSQLRIHSGLRPLLPSLVDRIKNSFQGDPTKKMLEYPVIGIPIDPSTFPTPSTDRVRTMTLRDTKSTVTVIDGQHRLQALRDFCVENKIALDQAFWPVDILHPCE